MTSDACVQYSQNNQSAASHSTNVLTIIGSEHYTVTVEPERKTVSLDDQTIRKGQTIYLTTDTHSLAAPSTLIQLLLRLAR